MTNGRTIGTAWLMSLSAVALGSSLGGCFVPPNFEAEIDGGGNSRPIIIRDAVTPPLGEWTVFQDEVSVTITVQVRDADEQTISGRLFLDLDFTKQIDEGKDPGGSNGLYAISFFVSDLCGSKVNNKAGAYVLSIVVTDGTFTDSGDDLSNLVSGSPGGRDQANWKVLCTER